ncbi:MAG: CCA tRNA nucleotidyltransferase [Actinobacteria bacterium]|nr:CCA tRNA nucleotidyltransferase [Actinomycetota bacterium]
MSNDSLTAAQRRQLGALVAVYPMADELGRRFAERGFELYLVGGTVRDTLLGRRLGDLDFATSATPGQTERVLSGWAERIWLTGARFGTVSARRSGHPLEITTFRRDVYPDGSRHPDVTFAPTIEADLARRDFTVNAMAVSLPDHRFVDPYGGLADLGSRTLRTPVEPATSFGDDPLRMVRMARFAATLEADVDEAARKAATTMAATLDGISRERIRDELSKLVCAPAPGRGLDLLCDTGLADRFLPELPSLRMERDPLHHHKDVYSHTVAVVERCPPHDLVLRLAALLHDVGKPATRAFAAGGRVTFHHHEVVGARMAHARLRELRYPNQVAEDVSRLVYLHLRFHGYSDGRWTDSAVRRYVHDAGTEEQLSRLNLLTRADVTTRNRAKAHRLAQAMDDLESRIAALAAQEAMAAVKPPLDGHEIMRLLRLSPGPLVGEARRHLLDLRLEHGPMDPDDAREALLAWARERGLA